MINFADLESFDKLATLEFEIERYKPFEIPASSTYDPLFKHKPLKQVLFKKSNLDVFSISLLGFDSLTE